MTTTQQPSTQPAIPAPDADQAPDTTVHVTLDPASDTDARLAQLQASYAAAKAAADAAAADLKTVTDGIKAELSARRTDDTVDKLQLDAAGDAPALRLAYVERWTVDSKKLKAQDPETYVRYARKSGTWTLTQVKG